MVNGIIQECDEFTFNICCGFKKPKQIGYIPDVDTVGLEASFFDEIESREQAFFANLKNPLKDEFLLPNMVDAAMKSGAADVTVLQTMAKWYGVTYHEDKETVQKFISDCIADNVYPGGLWK